MVLFRDPRVLIQPHFETSLSVVSFLLTTLDRGEGSYKNDSVLYGNWELIIMVTKSQNLNHTAAYNEGYKNSYNDAWDILTKG